MKTKTFLTLSLLAVSFPLCAKVIQLKCSYTNLNGGKNEMQISMDTENKTASANDTDKRTISGALYSDGSAYWFSSIGKSPLSIREKIQIDRNTLGFIYQITIPDAGGSKFDGTCEVIETKQPKI